MYYGRESGHYIPKERGKRYKTSSMLLAVVLASLISGVMGALTVYNIFLEYIENVELRPSVTIQSVERRQHSNIPEAEAVAAILSIEDAAEIALKSVVEVSTESKAENMIFGSYVTSGAGSGVIIATDGYIVTNDHVVSGCEKIVVRLSDGTYYEARLVASDVQTDLAILKIDAVNLPAALFADSSDLRVGQRTLAIGNPLGNLGGTVTEGIISAKDREIVLGGEKMRLLQTSAAINPGNSGGGLFDLEGSLIGIVTAKPSGEESEGLGFAIASNMVKEVAASLIHNGYVTGRAGIGVMAVEVSSWTDRIKHNVPENGVYITSAEEGSGFSAGDRIIAADGDYISDMDSLRSVINRHSVGDILDFRVKRGDEIVTVQAALSERRGD